MLQQSRFILAKSVHRYCHYELSHPTYNLRHPKQETYMLCQRFRLHQLHRNLAKSLNTNSAMHLVAVSRDTILVILLCSGQPLLRFRQLYHHSKYVQLSESYYFHFHMTLTNKILYPCLMSFYQQYQRLLSGTVARVFKW